MSTGFIVDEDAMMERFDAATEKLSRALDLDPSKFWRKDCAYHVTDAPCIVSICLIFVYAISYLGNEALREQVEALQGDEDGEGFADEDDEGGDFEGDEEEDDAEVDEE